MKHRRRRSAWLIPPLLLAGGMYLLRTDTVSRAVSHLLEAVIEQAIGEDVTIGRFSFQYWPPQIALDGVVLSNNTTGEPFLHLKALRVLAGHEGLRPTLHRIVLEQPQLTLHITDDGLQEFRNLPKRQNEAPATSFPWKELIILNGGVRVAGPAYDVALRGIELRPGEPAEGAPTVDLDIAELVFDVPPLAEHAHSVTLHGLTLTPDRIVVPSVLIQTEHFKLDGRVAAALAGELNGDLSLSADVGDLMLSLGKPGVVDGQVYVDANLAGLTTQPQLSGALAAEDILIGPGPIGTPSTFFLGKLSAQWQLELPPEPASPMLHLSEVRWPWSDGVVEARASLDLKTQAFTGGVTAEQLHLGSVLRDVGVHASPWVDFEGDVDTTVSGSLKPFSLGGPFEIALRDLRVHDGPVTGRSDPILVVPRGYVEGRFSTEGKHLVFDVEKASFGDSYGRAFASIPLGGTDPLRVDVDFPRLNLAWLQPLGDIGLGGYTSLHGTLGGPLHHLQARAELDGRDLRVLDLPIADAFTATLESPDLVRLHFNAIDAIRGQTRYTGFFGLDFGHPDVLIDTELVFPDGRLSDLSGIFLEIPGLESRISGRLQLQGEIYHLNGAAEMRFSEVDLFGEHFPGGYATAWMNDGLFTLEELILKRRSEVLLARGSIGAAWAMNMEMLWDGARLQDLDYIVPIGLPITGRLQVDTRIKGTLFDPAPAGRIAVHEMYYQTQEVGDSTIEFQTQDGLLSWDGDMVDGTLRADGTLELWDQQSYVVNADFERFPAHIFYPLAEDGSPVSATVTGAMDLSGQFGDNPTPVHIQGDFSELSASWDTHILGAKDWSFTVDGTTIKVPTLQLSGNDGTSFRFGGSADGDGNMRFSGDGKISLDLMRAVVPGVQEVEGLATVKVGISRNEDDDKDVDVEISASTRKAMIRTEYFPAPIEDLSVNIQATDSLYRIENLNATLGGGALTGEGSIVAQDWIPQRYALEALIEDTRVRYLDYLPPLAGDAQLSLDGPASDLLLSGKIEIEDMVFRDRIDWESMVLSLQEEYLTGSAPVESDKYFSMDIQILADETVHFRNNVANADASADLRIVGDTARPGMVGTINMQPGGQVYLQEREFELNRGEVRYVDPYTFDPDLDLVLETDVAAAEQDYHITYGVTGPFSNWTTDTSSDPYLSQADINALLLFGMTREEMERSGYGGLGTALVVETSDLLGAQLSRPLAFNLVDRWNLVSGVTERGASVVSTDPRIVAEKDNLYGFNLTLEMALNDPSDWYVSVERRIARRLYATTYATTNQVGRTTPLAAIGGEFKMRWEFD